MKWTMKTVTTTITTLLLSSVVDAYNPQHYHGKLGNTPQPNFVNRYEKPKKRGLTPWVSLKQIREGNSYMNTPDGVPPPPPPHHPFGMPLPFGGTGIPIAPDPNPNDYMSMNVEDAQQMEEFRQFLFQDMMHQDMMHQDMMHQRMQDMMHQRMQDGDHYNDDEIMEPPQGFNDFSNEDAWHWKKEHDMPHPGPPPPGAYNNNANYNNNQDHGNNHVQHPMQGLGPGPAMNSPLEPPNSNSNTNHAGAGAGGTPPQDPSLEALERMFRMKAYEKNEHQTNKPHPTQER